MKKNILIYIILVFILNSCEFRKEATMRKIDSLSKLERPDQVANDVEVIFNDSSFTKAILKAKRARVYFKSNLTFLDSAVDVEFMSKNSNKRMSYLTCDSARIDDNTKDMIAMGNVIVISDSSNIKLVTTILEWSNIRQKIYSNEYVEITTASEFIRGYGFESNPDLSNYRIFKVSGISRIK